MCNAIDPYFAVTAEIQIAICLIVESSYKQDATGIEIFRFLMSQRPNNCNVPIAFATDY